MTPLVTDFNRNRRSAFNRSQWKLAQLEIDFRKKWLKIDFFFIKRAADILGTYAMSIKIICSPEWMWYFLPARVYLKQMGEVVKKAGNNGVFAFG